MGDGADDALNRLYDDEAALYEPRCPTCRYCGQSELFWESTGRGWRLVDSSGRIHTCSAYKGNKMGDMADDFSTGGRCAVEKEQHPPFQRGERVTSKINPAFGPLRVMDCCWVTGLKGQEYWRVYTSVEQRQDKLEGRYEAAAEDFQHA